MKGSVGVELGIAVALLWGSVDILITTAARHLGTLKTSIIAQTAGMLILLLISILVFGIWHQTFTPFALAASLLLGLFSGLCAALGYFAFYSALKIGPLALISPLTASSSCITFLLAILIQEEILSLNKILCAFIVIIGVILSSTNISDLRQFLQKPYKSPLSTGIRWAILAMLAFGFMDLGIGASASISGWFLPVLWTRFFSLFFLLIFFALKHFKDSLTLEGQKNSSFAVISQATIQGPTYIDTYQNLPHLAPGADLIANLSTLTIPRVQTKMRTTPASLKRIVMVPLPYSSAPLPLSYSYPVERKAEKQHTSASWQFWWWVAILAGIIENIAVLIFSFDTRIITIGITSALASCYGIVGALFGVTVYDEQLTKNQLYGIGLCLLGIFLLAL